jgi:hypothetical protein
MSCERCGVTTHETRVCKVSFRKAWPGKPAVKATLRSVDGRSIDFELDLTPEAFAQILTLLTNQTVRR